MSYWTEIKKEDIEIDGDDLNVLIGSDQSGNNYIILKVIDILEELKQEGIITDYSIPSIKSEIYNRPYSKPIKIIR
jgi:hypothetical protein